MINFIRKVIRTGGGTYYVSIPREIASGLKLRERQKMIVRQSDKKIIIEDWPKKK